MMKVTPKEKTPEVLRLEKLQDCVAEASNLAYDWLNHRAHLDFTTDKGTPATSDDVMKEVLRRVGDALTQSYSDDGVAIGVRVQQSLRLKEALPESVAAAVRAAVPSVAESAKAGVFAAIEKAATVTKEQYAPQGANRSPVGEGSESAADQTLPVTDYLDTIVRQLNILNMLVTHFMGGKVSQADIDAQRK